MHFIYLSKHLGEYFSFAFSVKYYILSPITKIVVAILIFCDS